MNLILQMNTIQIQNENTHFYYQPNILSEEYLLKLKQWLQNKKLDQANQLLMNTDLSVTHIAADLGFDNVSHFIKIFKQKYKTTPKQFKQNN